MITAATFYDLTEAQLLCTRLKAEGIPAFIPDESVSTLQWTLINAIGGVRVQVPEEFEEETKELLAILKETASAESDTSCPACGSHDIHLNMRRRNWSIALLVWACLPIPFSTPYECRSCSHSWKPQASNEPSTQPRSLI